LHVHNRAAFGRLVRSLDAQRFCEDVLQLRTLENFTEHQPISSWPLIQSVLSRWVKIGSPFLDPKNKLFLKKHRSSPCSV
jgi:hypothetical protein